MSKLNACLLAVPLILGTSALGACEFEPPGSVLETAGGTGPGTGPGTGGGQNPGGGGGANPNAGQELFTSSALPVLVAGCGDGNGACHASTAPPKFLGATPEESYGLVKSSNLFAGFTYAGSTTERKLNEAPPHKGITFDAAQLAAINTWLAAEQ